MTSIPAPRGLFIGLIDDAAVFPPGNAPLPTAIRRHHEYRAASYEDLIGPLLVAAPMVPELHALQREAVIEIVVVGRPGIPTQQVHDAAARVDALPGFRLGGVELGWSADWRAGGTDETDPTPGAVLEVGRDDDQIRALDLLSQERRAGGAVRAKFRTGATPTWPWPDEAELAAFLQRAIIADVPFKLTGGLHHAVRAEHRDGPQHGLLNVLLAVNALHEAGSAAEAAAILAVQDEHELACRTAELTPAAAQNIRTHLTAYGCCGVTDPINELQALGLVEGDLS